MLSVACCPWRKSLHAVYVPLRLSILICPYDTMSNLSKTSSRSIQPSWNERDFHSHSTAIADVVLSEEFDQRSLLHSGPEIEKPPQENGKEDKRNPVLEGELCAEGPVEESRIRRMPEPSVDAIRHKSMSWTFLENHGMRKVGGCVDHGRRAEALSDEGYSDADGGNVWERFQRGLEI